MQNFKYALIWDKFSYIINTLSPCAYQALFAHFPTQTQCSFQLKESHVPKFPQGITDIIFNLAVTQVKELDYNGPVCAACDDTKLLSAF